MRKLLFAIDIGFGWTKAVVEGRRPFVFLSVVGPAVDVRYDGGIGSSGAGMTVEVDGRRYFVGRRALLQCPGARQTLDAAKIGDIDQRIQFCAAASELVQASGEDVVVITGLPVGDYNESKKRALRSLLEGHHGVEREGRGRLAFEVSEVQVLPQGMGALYGLALDRRGRVSSRNGDLLRGRVGVIDVGMLTTNFILAEDLRFVEQGSNSITIGVGTVLQAVAKDLKTAYDLDWTQQIGRVDEAVVSRSVTIYGEPKDISEIVDPHVQGTAEAIVKAAQSLPGWGSGVDLRAVILTGGGSQLLGSHIVQVYPHCRLGRNPQLDNVTGYLRSGLRRWG